MQSQNKQSEVIKQSKHMFYLKQARRAFPKQKSFPKQHFFFRVKEAWEFDSGEYVYIYMSGPVPKHAQLRYTCLSYTDKLIIKKEKIANTFCSSNLHRWKRLKWCVEIPLSGHNLNCRVLMVNQ